MSIAALSLDIGNQVKIVVQWRRGLGLNVWKEFGVLPHTSSVTAGCSSNLILPDLKTI